MVTSDETIRRALAIIAWHDGGRAVVDWTVDRDAGAVRLYLTYPTATTEQHPDRFEVTDDNIVDLISIYDAVAETTGGDVEFAPLIFGAHVRGVRPPNEDYPSDARLWPLLDAYRAADAEPPA